MTDTIVLLAISQLVCLSGMAYLYLQFLKMHTRPRRASRRGTRVHGMATARDIEFDDEPQYEMRVTPVPVRARAAYAAAATPAPLPRNASAPAMAAGFDAAAITGRMQELGVDVPTLAKRMKKSEEEVRLMLRRQGVLAR